MLVGRERRLLELTRRNRGMRCVVVDAQYCEDGNQFAGALYSYRSPVVSSMCFYWPEARLGLVCRVVQSTGGKKPVFPLPEDVDAAGLGVESCMMLRRRWSRDSQNLVFRTSRQPYEGQQLLTESSKGPPASVHMDLLYGYEELYDMMRDSSIHKVGCELDKLAHALYIHYDMALVNFSNIPEVDPIKPGSNMHIDPFLAFVPEAVLIDIHERITVMYTSFLEHRNTVHHNFVYQDKGFFCRARGCERGWNNRGVELPPTTQDSRQKEPSDTDYQPPPYPPADSRTRSEHRDFYRDDDLQRGVEFHNDGADDPIGQRPRPIPDIQKAESIPMVNPGRPMNERRPDDRTKREVYRDCNADTGATGMEPQTVLDLQKYPTDARERDIRLNASEPEKHGEVPRRPRPGTSPSSRGDASLDEQAGISPLESWPMSKRHLESHTSYREMSESLPVAGLPPTAEARPIAESLPTAGSRPVAESRQAAESRPMAESRSTAESRPMAESRSTAESRPMAESRSTAEPRSMTDSRPMTALRPMGEPRPTAEPRVTNARPPLGRQPSLSRRLTMEEERALRDARNSGRLSHGPEKYQDGRYREGPDRYRDGMDKYREKPNSFNNGSERFTNGPEGFTNGAERFTNGPAKSSWFNSGPDRYSEPRKSYAGRPCQGVYDDRPLRQMSHREAAGTGGRRDSSPGHVQRAEDDSLSRGVTGSRVENQMTDRRRKKFGCARYGGAGARTQLLVELDLLREAVYRCMDESAQEELLLSMVGDVHDMLVELKIQQGLAP